MNNAQRNLIWKLNWYRQSELEGSLLLGRMLRLVDDAALIRRLTRHCADEAQHSWLWARTIDELRFPVVRIARSYQSFYTRHGGTPHSLDEVMAFTHVFERQAGQFEEDLALPDVPEPARRTYQLLLRDEQDHLAWVGQWLATRPEGAALIARYVRIDALVYEEIEPYVQRVYDIPDLGQELSDPVTLSEAPHDDD